LNNVAYANRNPGVWQAAQEGQEVEWHAVTCKYGGLSTRISTRPDELVDEETQAILNERLKTIDNDARSARPWRKVMAESQAKLKHPAPQ